jgi:RNA polymerase sigma-70 factor (ECF subfamily)
MTSVLDMRTDGAISQSNDDLLVERLKARDKGAMEELIRVHGSKLYGLALQIMRNEDDAQEVMQDALLAVWNKVDMFEGRSAFSSWIYRVTANVALMRLRKQKKLEHNVSLDDTGRDNDMPLIQLPDPNDQPDTATVRTELGERVRGAIDALPEPYRSTVLLADVDGLSLAEIAEATESSVPAVKSRLHRARLALRQVLKPYLKEMTK